MGGVDLNRVAGQSRGFSCGDGHVRGQNAFRATHGWKLSRNLPAFIRRLPGSEQESCTQSTRLNADQNSYSLWRRRCENWWSFLWASQWLVGQPPALLSISRGLSPTTAAKGIRIVGNIIFLRRFGCAPSKETSPRGQLTRGAPQESPHFENGLISALLGIHLTGLDDLSPRAIRRRSLQAGPVTAKLCKMAKLG